MPAACEGVARLESALMGVGGKSAGVMKRRRMIDQLDTESACAQAQP